MEINFIIIYVLVNVLIIGYYFNRKLGVFQAPLILSCISLTIILPQLTTIYYNSYYNKSLIWILCYTMITCNIFFSFGFEIGKRKKIPKIIKEIRLEKSQYLALFFSLIGFTSVYLYNGNLTESIDKTITSNIKNFAHLSLSLSLINILKGNNNKIIKISTIISIITIVNFAFFVKASRGDTLVLVLNLLLFISLINPQREKIIKIFVLSFLMLGSVVSASISQYRTALVGKESRQSITEIDYLKNFKNAFTNSHTEAGMDIGNAGIGIDYCFQNNSYDYGLKIWNEFVFYFVPRRLIGEKEKNNLYYKAEYQSIIPKLTFNVTTMTGYFDAFSSFSFLGFLLFAAIGYLLGFFWLYASFSSFYKFIYFFVFTQVPLMVTISTQTLLFKLEIVFIFLYPLINVFMYKKNRQ